MMSKRLRDYTLADAMCEFEKGFCIEVNDGWSFTLKDDLI